MDLDNYNQSLRSWILRFPSESISLSPSSASSTFHLVCLFYSFSMIDLLEVFLLSVPTFWIISPYFLSFSFSSLRISFYVVTWNSDTVLNSYTTPFVAISTRLRSYFSSVLEGITRPCCLCFSFATLASLYSSSAMLSCSTDFDGFLYFERIGSSLLLAAALLFLWT